MIIKPQFKLKEYENGLYLVSTPLGNLKDITLRAIEVLQQSHYILCEDTRVSKNLLDKYQIKSKLISNHKFNEKKNVVKIIEYLKSGKIISLISDAGTPSISDPGSILVNECINNEIKIFPIPGPSAIAAAVSISGFSDKFLFCGFFPDKKQQLSNELKKFSEFENSLVFFISPKKINKIIVSTDDKQIAQISKSLKVEVPFLRPKSLATDNADMDKVILHAIKKLKKIGKNKN